MSQKKLLFNWVNFLKRNFFLGHPVLCKRKGDKIVQKDICIRNEYNEGFTFSLVLQFTCHGPTFFMEIQSLKKLLMESLQLSEMSMSSTLTSSLNGAQLFLHMLHFSLMSSLGELNIRFKLTKSSQVIAQY